MAVNLHNRVSNVLAHLSLLLIRRLTELIPPADSTSLSWKRLKEYAETL